MLCSRHSTLALFLAVTFGSLSAQAQVGAAGSVTGEVTGTGGAAVEKFPLSVVGSMNSSFGSGWLKTGPEGNPSINQSFTPLLQYTLPKPAWAPAAIVSARTSVSIEWMDNQYTETYSRVPRLSDFSLGVVLPGIYRDSFTGIGVTTGFGVRAPLSLFSRRWNVLGALTSNAVVSWSTAKLGDALPSWLGTFSLSLVPSASITGHTSPNPSLPCDSAPLGTSGVLSGNPVENLDRIPLVTTRAGEINAAGECIIPGRRVIGAFNGSGSAAWSLGNHSVIVSSGLFYQLLAPLTEASALSSPYATAQNWQEFTIGSVNYTYMLPLDGLDLPSTMFVALSGGVSSFQPSYMNGGRDLRFPFWDFATPAANWSSAYLSLDIGL
ncbi:MAG: hypothetical protein ACO3JL_04000 [Myxococcota bacterium]